MSNVGLYVLCCATAAYIVRVLLFDESTGPWESTVAVVYDRVDDGLYRYSVSLWDRVRRLFGAYRVEDTENGLHIWHTTVRIALWKCPKCLSFWVTFLVSGPFIFIAHSPFWLFPVVHFSMVFFVQLSVFGQLRVEGD